MEKGDPDCKLPSCYIIKARFIFKKVTVPYFVDVVMVGLHCLFTNTVMRSNGTMLISARYKSGAGAFLRHQLPLFELAIQKRPPNFSIANHRPHASFARTHTLLHLVVYASSSTKFRDYHYEFPRSSCDHRNGTASQAESSTSRRKHARCFPSDFNLSLSLDSATHAQAS